MRWWKQPKLWIIIGIILLVLATVFVLEQHNGGTEEPLPTATEAPALSATALPEISEEPMSSPEISPLLTSAPSALPNGAETKQEAKPAVPNSAVATMLPANRNTPTCTVTVRCDTVRNNLDLLDPKKLAIIPSDGVILPETEATFTEGESAFSVLSRVLKEKKIPFEYNFTPSFQSYYIEGINNLYEFDCGSLSGWEYQINGKFSPEASSQYILKDGDRVCYLYTCNMGKDIGAVQK